MRMLHMSGAGNDFAVIDARGKDLDFGAMAKDLCARLGCDGFMAVDVSEKADFKLHFYNSDGSRGEMCGNGARCICKFAYDLGIAGQTMVVETDAGLVPGWRLGDEMYRVQLNNPGVMDLNRWENAAYTELGNPGVPHSVTEVPGLDWDQADRLRPMARQLRFCPAFPKGANVNLYTWLEKATVRVMTYERGVEDYTLACGTGCGSTAAVLYLQGKLPGKKLTCRNKGGTLTVELTAEGETITSILLTGPAEVLKEYEI